MKAGPRPSRSAPNHLSFLSEIFPIKRICWASLQHISELLKMARISKVPGMQWPEPIEEPSLILRFDWVEVIRFVIAFHTRERVSVKNLLIQYRSTAVGEISGCDKEQVRERMKRPGGKCINGANLIHERLDRAFELRVQSSSEAEEFESAELRQCNLREGFILCSDTES